MTDRPAASVFTIPPGQSFVDALASGLLAECGGDAFGLTDYTILLPTRRACRALRDAFLRAGGGRAMMLPTMRPLGDVEEDDLALGVTIGGEGLGGEAPGMDFIDIPPGMPPLRRRLLLARLVRQYSSDITVDQAVRLAAELERFLDQIQTERLSFDQLAGLAPEEFALHWQRTLEFLRILTEHWPALLAEEGVIDGADRRNRLLEAQADLWRVAPPTGPVVAAGSTGSIPATADLLAVVAQLPNGRIVLPGLFQSVDATDWDIIARSETHPQFNIARLLNRLGLTPDDVTDWPIPAPSYRTANARATLMAEIMRPAETTDGWASLKERGGSGVTGGALQGVSRIDCADSAEEAGVIALLLRQTLETDGKTAALVSPDRALARRVAGALRRWGIEIDDSAGEPLSASAPGGFLRLCALMVLTDFAPVALLSALKHPLAACGQAPAAFRGCVRSMERMLLRGPRPGPGVAGLRAAFSVAKSDLDANSQSLILDILDEIERRTAPFAARLGDPSASFAVLLDAHIEMAEALADTDDDAGAARLWVSEAGESAAGFIAQLREAAALIPDAPGRRYESLLEALMVGLMIRPRFGGHPRLAILGLLEARLQHADLIVLGGLNEETWPPAANPDPWMSRPMRSQFGLPLPERRIGLTAHDFVQAFGAPEVYLTRAEKVDGQPTVPSRWLSRLDAVLRGLGEEDALGVPPGPWRRRRLALDQPRSFARIPPPEPRPPLEARPRQLSVTQIETWMRDPYSIFARHILKLRPLDPLEADPGAADRGTFIHAALDMFVRAYPDAVPPDALDRLLGFGQDAFGPALSQPAVWAFWWPRFERIAAWVIDAEHRRRPSLRASHSEQSGRLVIDGPEGTFTLTAKADRIDQLADGGFEIIDYKTGVAPSKDDVGLGFAPQLPLEAAIAESGGFADIPADMVTAMTYWVLSGGATPGRESKVAVEGDERSRADEALDGLRQLVASFDDLSTPYSAIPRPSRAPRFNDYAHLSRRLEWGVE
ncbi:MAG: double-strand break repair protein AddB [Rhodospirillaceae bacterium]|jgi:ATP-dependent helicase/nuclease subunit B|nr:double-strand break repair protein AddB [Rhodospirillaceae bacterium]